MAKAIAVGVDVGGTKLVGGVLHEDGSLSARQRIRAPVGDRDALVDAIVAVARATGASDLPVGVAVAGIVDRAGVLRHSPNHRVSDVPVGPRVAEALGCAVTVTNDANAAGLAEARFGAGRGHADVVMVTVGTGIGGGQVRDGVMVEGAHGFGAEYGHMVVHDGGRERFGNPGVWEAYASGSAIGESAMARLAAGEGRGSVLAQSREAIVGKDVTDAAEAGDAFAMDVLRTAGRWLGVGLVNLVVALDPGVVVVGGGAGVNAAEWLLPEARAVVAARVMGAEHRDLPPIVLAELGDDAGTIGAAAHALDVQRRR